MYMTPPAPKPPSGPIAVASPEAPPAIVAPSTEAPAVEIAGPKKSYAKPLLEKLGIINDTLPLSQETARQHLEAIVKSKTTPEKPKSPSKPDPAPDAPSAGAQPDQAAAATTTEPAPAAAGANPRDTETATATTPQRPIETAPQSEQINALLSEINKLLFDIGDANIVFTTLAAKANGTLPLGAELRRQVLEGIRKDFDARIKRGDRHKTSNVRTAKRKIDSIYPPDSTFDPKESAFVEFLNGNKAALQEALPESYDVNELIAKVETGDMSFAETFQAIFFKKGEKTEAFRRTLAQALTGSSAVPRIDSEAMLEAAKQKKSQKNIELLEKTFEPIQPTDWKKKTLTFGGLGLVLLMALAPMMMEGQGQGGGHGG